MMTTCDTYPALTLRRATTALDDQALLFVHCAMKAREGICIYICVYIIDYYMQKRIQTP